MLLMHASTWRYCHFCGTPEYRINAENLDVCKRLPQFTDYNSNVPCTITKWSINFVTVMNMSTNYEKAVNIGPEFAEIFGGIWQFLPSFFHSCCKNSANSLLKLWSYLNDFHQFLHDVEALVPLLVHAFTKQYYILFWNARTMNEGSQFWRLQIRHQN